MRKFSFFILHSSSFILFSVFFCVLCSSKSPLAQTKPAPAPKALVFTFAWKEEFTDLPRRIGIGDVTGDGTVRLVTLNEKPDSPNVGILMVRKWDGKAFVKEFEAETQAAPDKLQVGRFMGAMKPAVILTADALWTWNGKTFVRKLAAKPMNLFGTTRLRTGEERVLIVTGSNDIKAYKISPESSTDFLTAPIESPSSKSVTWGDMHAASTFFTEMGIPEMLSIGGVLGIWDTRHDGKPLLYHERIDSDVDIKTEGNKPSFTVKKQTYYLGINDPEMGASLDIWSSPPLPAPLLDVQISDAKPGKAAGFLMLLGEAGKNKKRLIAFVALQE